VLRHLFVVDGGWLGNLCCRSMAVHA